MVLIDKKSGGESQMLNNQRVPFDHPGVSRGQPPEKYRKRPGRHAIVPLNSRLPPGAQPWWIFTFER